MHIQSQSEAIQPQSPAPVYAKCPDGILWRWDTDEDRDADGFIRKCHMAVARNGVRRILNWSGFQAYYAPHFIFYVTNGFPAHQKEPPYHPCLPDCIEKMDGFEAFIGSHPFVAYEPSPYWNFNPSQVAA